MNEPRDEPIVVLSPVAERTFQPDARPPAPRLASLTGARICFVDNGFASTPTIHAELQARLATDGVQVVTVRKKYWRRLDPGIVAETAARIDALVSGVCTTPPSTTWGAVDSIGFERLGVATVTLVADYYETLLRETAAGEGMPDIKVVRLPYPIEGRPADELRSIAADAVSQVVGALTGPAETREATA